jgi:phospholipid-binding lipoprotein MlaA
MTAAPKHPLVRLTVVLLLLSTLSACASTTMRAADPRDPFEPINRVSYAVNDGLDRAVIRPTAKVYRAVTPKFMQIGVTNVFSNAKYPVTLVNNALQGKFSAAASDTGRFLLNTTVGVGGFFDPATAAGLERHDEDFGQTFGVWGIGAGPYFVVPLFGPTTLRDGLGSLADDFSEPRSHLEDDSTRWSLWMFDKLETRVRLLDADAVLDRSGDPYAFVRSAYLQRREFQVRDGNVPAEDLESEFADEDESTPDATP